MNPLRTIIFEKGIPSSKEIVNRMIIITGLNIKYENIVINNFNEYALKTTGFNFGFIKPVEYDLIYCKEENLETQITKLDESSLLIDIGQKPELNYFILILIRTIKEFGGIGINIVLPPIAFMTYQEAMKHFDDRSDKVRPS